MTVDLSYDELVLLVQLVQGHFVKLQLAQAQQGVKPEDVATPFEVALFKKLYDAHMDAMKIIKEEHAAGKPWQSREIPQEAQAPRFGGKAGESVPEVEPEDIKTVWQFGEELRAKFPSTKAFGVGVMEQTCKPGTNIEAVNYRAGMIEMLSYIAQQLKPDEAQQLAPWLKEGQVPDPVFRAIAAVPMVWIGSEVRQGFPFDVEEFHRRLNEQ